MGTDNGTAARQKADMFLNRLDWKVATSEIKQFTCFQVDIYKFTFKNLEGQVLGRFMAFVKTLDMTELKSVVKIWVWLYQHEVTFRLRFSWNPRLPAAYNLKNLSGPRRMERSLKACGHEGLMSYALEGEE